AMRCYAVFAVTSRCESRYLAVSVSANLRGTFGILKVSAHKVRKLKSVLIGCGNIARVHLNALCELENVQVAAVCDISPAKAEATAERFAIEKWYTSYSEMLANIHPDLVHITTPPSSHFPIAKSCLAAGLNVFCEKPIVANYKDFAELKQLAIAKRC